MIGFADEHDEAVSYGLIGGARTRRWSPLLSAGVAALALVGAYTTLRTLAGAASASSPALFATSMVLEAAEACPTKPFGQCAGLNFTSSKPEKDAYNYTTGEGQFACCPAGTSCIEFGPV